MPIKWIDLATGEVCFDPQKVPPSAADSGTVATPAPVRQPTARKSTTGRLMMQVALFRSAKFGSRQRESAAANNDDDDDAEATGDLKIVENDDEVDLTDSDDNADNADGETGSDDEVEEGSHSSAVYIDYDVDVNAAGYVRRNILRFCCHLCSFSVLAASPSALADHLNRRHHSDMCRLPAVEILDFDADDGGGATPMLLRRCGFCAFESYVGVEFDDHVLTAHLLARPLRCNLGCMYATFGRLQMHAHFDETHPRDAFSVSPLDKPYSMLPCEDDGAEDGDDIFVTFSAKVVLDDLFEWPEARFDALLSAHGAWY